MEDRPVLDRPAVKRLYLGLTLGINIPLHHTDIAVIGQIRILGDDPLQLSAIAITVKLLRLLESRVIHSHVGIEDHGVHLNIRCGEFLLERVGVIVQNGTQIQRILVQHAQNQKILNIGSIGKHHVGHDVHDQGDIGLELQKIAGKDGLHNHAAQLGDRLLGDVVLNEITHKAVLHLAPQSNHTLIKGGACGRLLNETVDHLHAQVLKQHTDGQGLDDGQRLFSVFDSVS